MSAAKDRAVVEAVEAVYAQPGHITRAEIAAALAAEPATPEPSNDPVTSFVEETV